MTASPRGLRARALLLLLILLVGGFGLPFVDALVFHSAAGAPVSAQDELSGGHDSAPAHLLGCAVWSSPAASTGLPSVAVAVVATPTRSPEPVPPSPTVLSTRTSRTAALPRAPPVA